MSISRGADQLMISQPAVSKQLKLLEQTLKTRLLNRHAKGVSLTASGTLLADYAARIFSLVEDGTRAMHELTTLKAGSLSIGAGPTVGTYLLPRAMVQFRREHTEVQLRVETEAAPVLRQRLLDGMIELAVSESVITSPELCSKVLMHDLLVPVVGIGSSLLKRRSVSATEFCSQPFIVRQVESADGTLVERTLIKRGLRINRVLTVGSTEAIKQAAIAGLGVAIISQEAIRTELAAGLLFALKVRGLAIRYPIYQIWRRGRSLNPLSHCFLDLLRPNPPAR